MNSVISSLTFSEFAVRKTPSDSPREISCELRDQLISFTFYCVAISSHPSCRIPERSKALWVLWAAPLPCTPVRAPSPRLRSARGVAKLPDFRLFSITRPFRRSRIVFLPRESSVSETSDSDLPGHFRRISRVMARESRLARFIAPRSITIPVYARFTTTTGGRK